MSDGQITGLIIVWLYVWGWLMMAALNITIEEIDGVPNPVAHWIGSLFWPIIVPVVFAKRVWVRLRINSSN